MKILIISIHILVILLLILCIIKSLQKKGALANAIALLLFAGIFTLAFSGISMLVQNKLCAFIINSLYFVCFDWLIIAMLNYVGIYTRLFKRNIIGVLFFCGIAAIDCISLLLNPHFHHLFDLKQIIVTNDYYIWVLSNTSILLYIHLSFVYFVVALCISTLILKAIKTPRLYRRKYLTVVLLFFSVIITNAIYTYFDFTIDFSLLFYCIFAVVLCYYSLFFKSKRFIENTLALVVTELHNAIICFDLWGKCVYYNDTAKDFITEFLEKKPRSLSEIKLPTDEIHDMNETIEELFSSWVKQNNHPDKDFVEWTEQLEYDGKIRHYQLTYRKHFDKNHFYLGSFVMLSDRTSEMEQFNKEHYRMTHDKLTDLYNRNYFFECVQRKLQKNHNKQFYMLCTNIKGFKLYNDLFGLKMGDKVLMKEAELLKKNVPAGSVCSRISGDEFAILIEKDSFDEKPFLDIINSMKEKFSSNLYQLHIYVGIYEIADYNEAPSLMCDKCKLAIEAFKEDYHTFIVYYNHDLLEKSLNERKIVSEFDNALIKKQFHMYLQPQISSIGEILGAEALVRWEHPVRGLIFPGDFIEILEKTGLIFKLDLYMWEQAAQKLAEWKEQGNDTLYISVNISAKDFYYIDIYKELTSLVEKYNIAPQNLKVEITETAIMKELHDQLEPLQRLRTYGFLVEIDDFGSGYSSLNMLKNIDVDIVKIDMGFLREVEKERIERSELILDFIIAMIKKLGMEVITEGVETKEQVDSLTSMGTDTFQGYYFSKPIPVKDFEEKYF